MPSPPADDSPTPRPGSHKVLILEPDSEGHALEWLEHLMAFVASERKDTEIWLVAPKAACQTLANAMPAGGADRIRLVPMSPLELLSLPLALGLGAGGKRLSGILFRPSVHYGTIGPYNPSPGERLRDGRKDLLYRLMLRNPALERVLSLDPFFPEHARRRYPHGDKVVALP